jgi:hypothetical protein
MTSNSRDTAVAAAAVLHVARRSSYCGTEEQPASPTNAMCRLAFRQQFAQCVIHQELLVCCRHIHITADVAACQQVLPAYNFNMQTLHDANDAPVVVFRASVQGRCARQGRTSKHDQHHLLSWTCMCRSLRHLIGCGQVVTTRAWQAG